MNPQWDPVYFLVAVVCSSVAGQSQENHKQLNLEGKNCNEYKYSPMTVGENDRISLRWDEGMSEKCSLSFDPEKKDVMDEYKVCVSVKQFFVKCRATLTLQQDGSDQDKVYSCNDHPSTWCGNIDSTVYLKVKVKSSFHDLINKFLGAESAMKLEITTEKIYSTKDTKKLALYIGLGAGGLVAIIIVGIFVGYIIHNVRQHRKNRHERHTRIRGGNHTTVTGQNVREDNNDYSRQLVPQPSSPPIINVQLERDSYRPELDPDLSDLPPPSYEEVMALEEESREYK